MVTEKEKQALERGILLTVAKEKGKPAKAERGTGGVPLSDVEAEVLLTGETVLAINGKIIRGSGGST
ncbi:hypothetical protein FJZ40_02775 [Candidatus Shapirobacteria bacterium]|nr:hypothetical protein [Candidatus Shapirobacteria bacterium]